MKQFLRCTCTILVAMISIKAIAQPCNLSGTFTVGPSGNYASLTIALDSLRSKGLGGPVILELQAAYTSAAESFPIAFAGIPCMSPVNNITVRPSAGATMVNISSSNSGPTISLANSRYIYFDGRPGGTGNTRALQLQNSNLSGNSFTFSNDASFNTLSYLNIRGRGKIIFSGSVNNITNGNSNNTISNCDIGDASGVGAYCIYSAGSIGKKNTNNKVLNCVLYDYFSSSSPSTAGAVFLDIYNDQWEITGNNIYNTIAFTSYSTGRSYGIYINDTTSSGFAVNNNFIGGTAPLCGGIPLVYRGHWTGISINAGSSSLTAVKNNSISNINWSNQDGSEVITGIRLVSGRIQCSGNIIGSETQRGNISTTSDYLQNAYIYGIAIVPPALTQTIQDTFIILNNKVAGFIIRRGSTNYFQSYFNGIYATGINRCYLDIYGNSIGSAMPNSIECVVTDEELRGINVEITDSSGSINNPNPLRYYIRNNSCNNFYGQATGIRVYNGSPQLTGNTISNLYDAYPYSNSITGIAVSAPLPGALVEANQVYGLRGTNAEGTPRLTGILGSAVPDAVISRNFVHSFRSAGTAYMYGIFIDNSSGSDASTGNGIDIQNNMISLGNDSAGIAGTQLYEITGISTPLYNAAVRHNSVNITGNGTANTRTAALELYGQGNSNNRVINNIFQNNRSFTSGNPAFGNVILFDDTIQSTARVLLNNNIYYTNQPGNSIVNFKGTSYKSIKEWRRVSMQDSNSVVANPNFINDAGGQQTVNLHLASATPAEAQAMPDATITTDFDGQDRSSLSPADIGADAGNFVLKDGDAPVITPSAYSLYLLNTAATYKTNITDNGFGVDTNGINKPRMWFRKSYPVVGNWQSAAGNLTTGTIKGGDWTFTPAFNTLGLAAGDSIAYYFAAQDNTPFYNMGYSHADSTLHSSVNNQLIEPIKPSRLFVYSYFPDTVYVGSGQLYTSFSNDSGFFQAAQKYQFNPASDSVQVIVTSDLSEKALYRFTMFAGAGPAVKISTNTPVLKQVKNANQLSAHMIAFGDNYNISIDGSVNGSGRYLQFSSERTFQQQYSYATLYATGITKNFSIKNCLFSSNNTNPLYATVELAGKNQGNMTIQGNLFSNITGANELPKQLLEVSSADTLLISNNEFANFNGNGISFYAFTGSAAASINIDGNHFYYNRTTSLGVPAVSTAILVSSALSPVSITNNYIGGSEKFCGGVPWRHRYESATITGIYYNGNSSYVTAGSIQNNTIRNFRLTTSGSSFTGIKLLNGNFDAGTLLPNTIGQTIDTNIYIGGTFIGIDANCGVGTLNKPMLRISNTSISGVVAPTIYGMYLFGRRAEIKNNTVNNCLALTSYTGIKLSIDSGLVEKNIIYNLNARSPFIPPSVTDCNGIDAAGASTTTLADRITLSANKVYKLRIPGSYTLAGIRTGRGQFTIVNNQVNLSNDSVANTVLLRGLYMYDAGNAAFQNKVLYNSFRLFGNAAGNTTNSYAACVNGGSPIVLFRNNLLYNQRSGGTGKHLALGMLSTATNPAVWPALNAANNLYVTLDTASVNEWQSSGIKNLQQWQTLSQGDNNSYSKTVQKLPADSIFISPLNSDLNVNSLSQLCWYLNEKGKPVAEVSGDFSTASGVRSVDTSNGKSDIGSDEFVTATTPPPSSASLCAGGNITMISNLTGAVYQWQLSTGAVFVNINDNTNYSGTGTALLQLVNIPATWYGYQYRCLVNGNYSDVFSLEFTNQWTGAVSAAWEDPVNWSCGIVPDANTDVIIMSGTVLLGSNGNCRSISISSTASFTIAAGFTLTITH